VALLYETAARAGEVLALDVDELDLVNRCAKVRRKGNANEHAVAWAGCCCAASSETSGGTDQIR
jgi:integrase